jgi:hypothetical protein
VSDEKQRPPFSSQTTERVSETIGDAAARLERETENFIRYINNEVVPEVRRHSSRGLRTAADKLREFAEYLDKRSHS